MIKDNFVQQQQEKQMKNQLKEAARDLIKGYGKDIGIDFEVVYLDEET